MAPIRPREDSWMETAPVKPFNDDADSSADEKSDDGHHEEMKKSKQKSKGVAGPADAYGVDKKILKKFLKNLSKNRKETLASPLPVGLILQCRIQRSGNKYFLNLDMPSISSSEDVRDGRVLLNDFLLAGKKRKRTEPPSFIMCNDRKEISRNSHSYMGKVNSDIRGLHYQIFDDGVRPSGSTFDPQQENTRCELAVLEYRANVLGTRGPRKLKMYLPPLNSEGAMTKWQPTSTNESYGIRGNALGQKPPFKLINKKPMWNETTQSYQLNYYGRASVASVKNFQLVHEDNNNQVFLQLGKISNDAFILDFQYPFSPILAFGTAIASFASKRGSD